MSLSSRISIKLYYKFWNFILHHEPIRVPDIFKNKINLFIYFDYEREFGNINAKITEVDIIALLRILSHYNLKSSWFTVGKIFDAYPDSISEIINNGHEIGSHTYSHIAPLHASEKSLETDFYMFQDRIGSLCNVKGFHSPNGKWSVNIFKQFLKYNYSYDLITRLRNKPCLPLIINYKKTTLLRFQTIGDDWPLYDHNPSEHEVAEYFMNKVVKLNKGDIAGIGFHPWVLITEKKILNGFELFIKNLGMKDDIKIYSIPDILKHLSQAGIGI